MSCREKPSISQTDFYNAIPDSLITAVESGQLDSEFKTTISSPGDWDLNYQIVYLPPEGTTVKQGEVVVVFDTKETELQLDQDLKQLEKLQESLKETKLNNQQTIGSAQASLRMLEIQEQVVLNQLEMSKYNSDTEQKNAELELQKIRLNLKKEQEGLKAQRILNKNSETAVQLKINQTKTNVKQRRSMIAGMHISSPKSGFVIYNREGRHGSGTKIKIGDSIRPQMPVVSIPDLNNMIAVIDLNEVDRPFIHEGDSAELIVEAYPDTVFTGRVVFVSKIVEYLSQSSRAKVYTVHVKINSRENYRLKPGLSAMVKLYLENVGQVFRVPSWCLFSRENAFFLTTSRAQEIPIELIRLADGNAFVIGKIDDKMKFTPNQHTPTF